MFLSDIGGDGTPSSLRRNAADARRPLLALPGVQTPAELMGCLIRQMPPILLAAYFSMEAVGLYWLTNRVLERPTLLFGVDMSRVFMQQIAERRDHGGNVLSLFVRVTLFMAALPLVPFLLVIVFGPQLFAFVFGAEWYHAGEYARWMALFSFAYLFALPTRAMTAVFGLQRAYAVSEVIRAALGAMSIVLAAKLTGDDVTAMAAFSVVQLAVLTVFVVAVFLIVRRLQARKSQPLGTLGVLS
ncbi:MAG: oligosaccharide flippase family protein [Rhodospirillales bacterium]